MAKISWKPGTMIYPLPAVLVSCGSLEKGNANIVTVAWTGTICTNPPMLYISLRPERYSYDIIKSEMQFTVNLTTSAMVRDTDWAGVRSGRDYNKFKETELTPIPGVINQCCMIEQSPLSIECKVKEIMHLGSHDMFIADVINVVADDKYLEPDTGRFNLEAANLMTYSHGKYYELGNLIGSFGFSVKKEQRNK